MASSLSWEERMKKASEVASFGAEVSAPSHSGISTGWAAFLTILGFGLGVEFMKRKVR